MKTKKETILKMLVRFIVCLVLTAAMVLSSVACVRSLADDGSVEATPEATDMPDDGEESESDEARGDFRVVFDQEIVHATVDLHDPVLSSYYEPEILVLSDELVPDLAEAFEQVELSVEGKEGVYNAFWYPFNHKYLRISLCNEDGEKVAALEFKYKEDISECDQSDVSSLWAGYLRLEQYTSGDDRTYQQTFYKIVRDPSGFMELLEGVMSDAIGADFRTYRTNFADMCELHDWYHAQYYAGETLLPAEQLWLVGFRTMYPNALVCDFDEEYWEVRSGGPFMLCTSMEGKCHLEAVSPEE